MAIVKTGAGIAGIGASGAVLAILKTGTITQSYVAISISNITESSFTARFIIPVGKIVEIIAPNDDILPYTVAGEQTVTFQFIELGAEGPSIQIGVRIQGEATSTYIITRPDDPVINPPTFTKLTDPVLTTTGVENAAMTLLPPTWDGEATLDTVYETSVLGVAPFTEVGPLSGTVPPDPGTYLNAKCTLSPFDGSAALVLRTTPFVIIDDPAFFLAPETAFTSAQFSIVRADRTPDPVTSPQSTPVVNFSALTNTQKATIQIQFRRTPLDQPTAPWYPAVRKGDEPAYFSLTDPTGNSNHLWGPNDDRTTLLRFRHRYDDNQQWSIATPTVDVPAPPPLPPVTPGGVDPITFSHSAAEMNTIDTREMNRFIAIPWTTNGTGGQGCYRPFGVQTPVNYAVSAYAGDTRQMAEAAGNRTWTWGTYGTIAAQFIGDNDGHTASSASCPGFAINTTAEQRLLAQLRFWGNTQQTMPRGSAGYGNQYEIAFVCTVAIARRIPSVWNALTTEEKRRIKGVMKACLVGACFQDSDWHDRAGATGATIDGFPKYSTRWGPGSNRTVRAMSAGRNGNPNYSLPPKFVPRIVALFMNEDGEDAQAFLNSFNQAAFVAELDAAGGCQDAADTYRQEWTIALCKTWNREITGGGAAKDDGVSPYWGPGPSAAHIKRAITGGSANLWKSDGFTLDQSSEVLYKAIKAFFSVRIQPGPTEFNGVALPGAEVGPGWTTKHGYKATPYTRGVLRGCLGKPTSTTNPATSPTDKSAWANLPNRGLMHRAFELESGDAGNNGGVKFRAAMSYTHQGYVALMMAAVTLAIYDVIDKSVSDLAAVKTKLNVGIQDLNFIDANGWRSYAKGGTNSAGSTIANNEDWDADMAAGDGYLLTSEAALSRVFLKYMDLP